MSNIKCKKLILALSKNFKNRWLFQDNFHFNLSQIQKIVRLWHHMMLKHNEAVRRKVHAATVGPRRHSKFKKSCRAVEISPFNQSHHSSVRHGSVEKLSFGVKLPVGCSHRWRWLAAVTKKSSAADAAAVWCKKIFIHHQILSVKPRQLRCQTETLAVRGKCRISCSDELFRKRWAIHRSVRGVASSLRAAGHSISKIYRCQHFERQH